MTKKLMPIVLLCLYSLNSALYASATVKKIDRYKIPVISGKKAALSEQKFQKQDIEVPKTDISKNIKIGPVLNNFLAGTGCASVAKTGPNKDRVRIIVNTAGDKTSVYNAVTKYDARIINEHKGAISLEVPIDNIEKLVNETDAIKNARLPMKLFPLEKFSEGVNLLGANSFHTAGYTGAGIRIAVIDVGFKGLTEAYIDGDIPYGARTFDLTGNGLETEYYHGTACAELVYDMAPGAELYLLKVADEIDIYNAIDYCIKNKIEIISFSLGASGTGPGNGTGDFDEAFNEAMENGILVVAAAGNYANYNVDKDEDGIVDYTLGGHWEGIFNDPDSDGRHEFIEGDPDSEYNVIGAYPSQNDDGDPSDGEVSILMRWDDWINRNVDYDIYLYKYDYENNEILNPDIPVGYSNITQNGSQQPIEQIVIDLANDAGNQYYALVVRKKTGEPAGTELEIYLGGTSSFLPLYGNTPAIATSGSSITEPADAESVLAVGAIYYGDWEDGPQEDFASQGPTNAWAGSSARVKPDICGPDGLSTYTYGAESFFGTSASTPVVAGTAALILSIHPDFNPDELKSHIESNAIDMGDEGKDNLYGWGRINLTLDVIVDPDQDGDGMPDNWEFLYGLKKSLDDSAYDPDSDGYTNLVEYRSKTNPLDADTDDDGISDGDEDANHNSSLDPGETYATRTDSDDDGLQDGTEQGITAGMSGTDTNMFIPDSDPTTTTDPTNADTDGDDLKDGEEDSNHNGMIDSGETDPNVYNATAVNTDTSDDNSGGGGGCFIATAAYGSYLEPHVLVLRQFRDNFLLKNSWGKAFMGLYYRYSPPAAAFIAQHDVLRAMVRWCLLPLIWMSQVTLLFGMKGIFIVLAFTSALICVTLFLLFKISQFIH
jgi:hypothetical protein